MAGYIGSHAVATQVDGYTQTETQALLGNRCLIMNAAMSCSQRSTSEAGVTSGGYYTVDRFQVNMSAGSTWTMTQEADGPAGFANSVKLAVTSTDAVTASEYIRLEHRIEAQDLQHLEYGAAGAKSVTLSFWTKASTTGTYAVTLFSHDGTRQIGSTFTVASAGTWEEHSVTFAGDVSGTINNDNGRGLDIAWYLDAGSSLTTTDNTSWAGYIAGATAYGHAVALGNTGSGSFQITGIQLEVGSATPFEHENYGQTLAKCQRYFCWLATAAGWTYSSTGVTFSYVFPVSMRATPTLAVVNGTGGVLQVQVAQRDLSSIAAAPSNIGGRSTATIATSAAGAFHILEDNVVSASAEL